MLFFKQFETFDPVSSDVPPYPFSYMPAIGLRARALMNFRMPYGSSEGKKERIIAIARRINQEIEQYFDDIKYWEIERLREEAGLLESMGGDPEWPPNEDDLDIQTWVNVNEVDALKSIFEKRDLFTVSQALPPDPWGLFTFFKTAPPMPEECPECKDFEFFAVLALWMLADALLYLNDSKHGLSIAGEYALKAMDAVCYAEHLHEAEWLVSYAEKQGDIKLSEALKTQKTEHQKQRTAQSKQLSFARHQKTKEAKMMLIKEFMKDRNKFSSAEKAGNHFADWLGTQGVVNSATRQPYEPRTVINWIRSHAKEIGLRFR